MAQGRRGDGVPDGTSGAERREVMRWFYRQHQVKLLAYVARRVGGRMEAEDVCQETWLAFFVKYDEYRVTYGRAVKVLYAIARCRIVDFWRRRGRTREELVEGDDLVLLANSLWSDNRLRWDINSRIDIERALAALPPRQREALHLHYVDDLTVAVTAMLMGVSENAVKKQVKKALQMLRAIGLLRSYGPEGELE